MKYAIVALLVIHGLIHAMGLTGAWDLAEFRGASGTEAMSARRLASSTSPREGRASNLRGVK